MELSGKTAIVTGGTKGIGRGVAEALVKAGVNVCLGARSQQEIDEASSYVIDTSWFDENNLSFPDIAQARADLSRRRVAQPLPDDLRQLLGAIDSAVAGRHYGDAERLIADGNRRYPAYAGWPDLTRRLAEASSDMSHYDEFDYVVVNDQFEKAALDVSTILDGGGGELRSSRSKLKPLIATLVRPA